MTRFVRNLNYSFAEYLEMEQISRVKHEYFAGEIFGMAGGSPEHAALSMAVGGGLLAQLAGGPCTVYSSDLRVRVLETGLATYPDVTVVCGEKQRDPESSTTLTNPTVLVEVVSNSTEQYDRGEKFEQYKRIASLESVVFVAQNTVSIDVWSRVADTWQLATYSRGMQAQLKAIDCELDVDAIYRVVQT
jgi:Uma2 family endonuclease